MPFLQEKGVQAVSCVVLQWYWPEHPHLHANQCPGLKLAQLVLKGNVFLISNKTGLD